MQLPHPWTTNIAGTPGQYGQYPCTCVLSCSALHKTKSVLHFDMLQVPHPWTTNIAGAPGQYGQYLGPDGAPLGILVPNPAAPDDPR
jgi:hypothetical protein